MGSPPVDIGPFTGVVEVLEIAVTDPAGLVVVGPATIGKLVVGEPCPKGDEVLEMATTDEASPSADRVLLTNASQYSQCLVKIEMGGNQYVPQTSRHRSRLIRSGEENLALGHANG